jgi:hypothetical protein
MGTALAQSQSREFDCVMLDELIFCSVNFLGFRIVFAVLFDVLCSTFS